MSRLVDLSVKASYCSIPVTTCPTLLSHILSTRHTLHEHIAFLHLLLDSTRLVTGIIRLLWVVLLLPNLASECHPLPSSSSSSPLTMSSRTVATILGMMHRNLVWLWAWASWQSKLPSFTWRHAPQPSTSCCGYFKSGYSKGPSSPEASCNSSSRSVQSSPTSATPRPPSRVVDENYDEGVADVLINLSSYRAPDNNIVCSQLAK